MCVIRVYTKTRERERETGEKRDETSERVVVWSSVSVRESKGGRPRFARPAFHQRQGELSGSFSSVSPEGGQRGSERGGAQQNRINATEARIFWLALILCPFFWSLLFIAALFGFKFKWLLLVCIAIVLNGANLYGYVKCKMGNDQNISTATSDFIRKQVLQNVTSIMNRSPPTNNSNQPTNVI
ncbi:hypothetical protein ALC60_09777 [Trachymyrmex zeteki]|uniref:Golgi apparatus membrane protein TVP23 homolog n=1 Tax=Mycetomoellerius zeteki TaxID=64791 RepID=A0A151WTB3_9HYME|nr:hypothetical protein ALC60_09777 [Trachymyrmex zeteki]